MSLDQDARRRARQELLEAVSVGMAGPVCAPMPGILLEMLEIAAMERRAMGNASQASPEAPAPLTSAANGSGMTALLTRVRKALVDVANRFKAVSGARRVPI